MNTAADQFLNRLAELSPTKRKLLELRLSKRTIEPPKTQIPQREKSLAPPLSFAQQRLWFLEQLHPNTSTYIMANAVPMLAPVNERVLEQTLNEIVRRHEVLRTIFPIIDGSPSQVISESLDLQLPYTDLSILSESDRNARILQFINEIKRPFDLQRGPLVRATLLRLTSEQYVLYLALHHIVADGWSLGLFAKELAALYDAFSLGNPSPLPELSIQYADFAIWQREWLKSEVMVDQLAYWKKQLAGMATLNLRAASRPVDKSHKSAAETMTLSVDLALGLKALARQEGVTLFMTVLAAFQLLLARYSGQTDIVVGSPVAGRTRVEAESLIGCFVNMLVLRSDLSGNPSFSELLRRVKEMSLRAYENQQIPFEMLVEELRPQRDLTRSPLFQVMFALESSKSVQSATRDVFYTVFVESAAKYDLTLNVAELERGLLLCSLDYDSSLFEPSTIKRLMGHFEVLLNSVIKEPRRPIFELDMLPAEERRQLVVGWNQTRTNAPTVECVHQLFEEQARRAPKRVAVADEEQRLTYGDLDRRANWMAKRLRQHGVAPGHLVGICLERSVEMLVSLLAVLKAGAAYVPVDPTYPAERLRFMQKDAGLKAAITQKHLLGLIIEEVEIICLENEERSGSSNGLNERVTSEDLAYAIYTSGSTGTPKGVAVSHGSVVNLLESMKLEPGICQDDRLLAVTTLSFDIAALELLLPLTVGAQVIIANRETAADPQTLAKKIKRSNISIMQATPATWQMLEETGWAGDQKLKVLCGGEALPRQLANELVDHVGEVWNMYGPTETTIWSSTCRVQRESGPVLLGRGIANTKFYVLDDHRQLLPVGVPGELYIGGKGVARGYWKRPELTKDRFISNPFREEDGCDRLYRTGDLVRYREDGMLEYLGRIDHQVKIRGHRIELGEIETALREAGVREAVVVESEDGLGHKRLVGYFVGTDGASGSQELRQRLKQKLPEYMIPALLIELERLPLSPAGKVDRKALPNPQSIEKNAGGRRELQDELEDQLTRIWERLLGCQVRLHDDFFELGGHSLMAVRLFVEMERVFGRTLPLATLFTAPTIEQLAAVLRRQGWQAPYSSLVPLQPRGTLPPFFCVHSLGANLVSYRHLAGRLGTDQPFYGLQPQGLDGKQEPHSRVEDMAAHYIKEIKTVQPKGPYFLGGVCLGGVVAFEMAQQFRAQGDQVERVVLIDSHFPVFPKHYLAGAFRSRGLSIADGYLGDLLALSGKQKFRFVADRVQNVALRRKAQAESWMRRFMRKDQTTAVLSAVLQRVKDANAIAEASYVPQYYPGHLIQLWCTEMPTRSYKDRRLAWSEVAGGGLEVHVIPGNHMTMIEQPHIAVLSEKLRQCLHAPRVVLPIAS